MTLARILTDPTSFGTEASSRAESLCRKYDVLLNALHNLGCFFLRRGAIENYYGSIEEIGTGKPDRAALEAAGFDVREMQDLSTRYRDVYAALYYAAPNQLVDEDHLLRMKLGAILTPVMLGMTLNSSDQQLDVLAREGANKFLI